MASSVPPKALERALHRVELLQREIEEYYRHFRVSNNLLELRNLTMVAELIIRCAMAAQRKSRSALHAGLSCHAGKPNANHINATGTLSQMHECKDVEV